MGDEPFFRAPLYPYTLALIYKLSGGSYLVPRIIQFLVGALTSTLVLVLTTRLAGRLAGFIAGLICATYPVLIYFDGEILTENLFIFLVVLGLYLLHSARGETRKRWFGAGISLGLALITRPTIGLFLPFAALGPLVCCRKRRIAPVLLVIAGIVLPVVPVTIHNYVVSGEFIPVVWQAGINFYLGNNAAANGWSATSPEIRKDWWGGYHDMIAIPRTVLGRQPTYGEVSAFWISKGLKFIRSEPLSWLRLMLKKVALFWNSREFPNNQDYNFVRSISPVLRLSIVGFATVAPLALVGLLLCLRSVRTYYYIVTYVLAYFVATIAFFVCARYRAPIVPALCILAAIAVTHLIKLVRETNYRRLAGWLGCLAGFALLVNLNLPGEHLPDFAQSYTQIGKVLAEKGNSAQAIEYFKKALEVNPEWAEAYEQIGILKMREGDYDQAIEYLSKATEILPDMASAYRSLAMVYLKRNQLEEARSAIEQALRFAPFIEDGYNLLATIEHKRGNFDQAEKLFKRELELHPDNWRAWVNLGTLMDDRENPEAAASAYEHALSINPDDADIALALASIYAKLGKMDRVREIVDRLGPRATANINLRYNQAVLLQNSGKLEQARAIYEEILKINPGHEGALINLGVIYARTGKPEEARHLWQKALRINPDNQTARRNLRLLDQD